MKRNIVIILGLLFFTFLVVSCSSNSNSCDTPKGSSFWIVSVTIENDNCNSNGNLDGLSTSGEMDIYFPNGQNGVFIQFESYSGQPFYLSLDYGGVPTIDGCIKGSNIPGTWCESDGYSSIEINIHGDDLSGSMRFENLDNTCKMAATMSGTPKS